MTRKQIQWAAFHDWFVNVLADGEGVLVRDEYVQDGILYRKTVCFHDYRALRDWAGY